MDSCSVSLFEPGVPLPDPTFADYATSVQAHTPIIIDCGGFNTRVGWATESGPRLNFRSAAAKLRAKKGDADIFVGSDVHVAEQGRPSLQTPFDQDIHFRMDTQELILDHAFSHLGISSASIEHPVVMTEAICSPNYSRNLLCELMYECYGVPSLVLGVDAMFALYHNRRQIPQDACIVRVGHSNTHVVPVMNGVLQPKSALRLSVGGQHAADYLGGVLEVKYPYLKSYFTPTNIQQLMLENTYTSLDYMGELSSMSGGSWPNLRILQLPYTSRETVKAPPEKKKVDKSVEIQNEAKLTKIRAKEDLLTQMINLKEKKDGTAPAAFNDMLAMYGFVAEEQLDAAIAKLSSSIKRAYSKLQSSEVKAVPEPVAAVPQQGSLVEMEELQSERAVILARQAKRDHDKLRASDRRSMQSQQRMRMIAQQAADNATNDDGFGADDADWAVYEKMADRHGSTEEGARDFKRLEVIEEKLQTFAAYQHVEAKRISEAKAFQIQLDVERIRIPEVVFQPSLLGSKQCGLSETLELMLNRLEAGARQRVVQDVFVCGGASLFPRFQERLTSEMASMLPMEWTYNVSSASDPLLDPWRGAALWASGDAFAASCCTRSEYFEKGHGYLKEHQLSNRYFPK